MTSEHVVNVRFSQVGVGDDAVGKPCAVGSLLKPLGLLNRVF